MEAIRIVQKIYKTGELTISNVPVEAGEEVEVLVLIPQRRTARPRLTAKELLESDIVGMWKDRDDIGESSDYARELRDQVQRGRGGDTVNADA